MPHPHGSRSAMGLNSVKKNTVFRLLSYLKNYKLLVVLDMIAITLTALSNVLGMTYLEVIVDDYVKPLLLVDSPDFSGLLGVILQMAAVFGVGVVTSLFQGIFMARVAQGVQKKIRDDMFYHMQRLPIKYFDTHTFGDVMSYYTNDVDTLRQMLSQSIPQTVSSLVTIVTVFITMLVTSPILTLFVIVCLLLMLQATKKIGGNSAKYFIAQQKSIGNLNGYIEEMISGQRVIKVFCHEEATKEEFDRRNEELQASATKANIFANILMPIMMNLGNLQYVLVAILGGALAVVSHESLITMGGIMLFLQLSKNFTRPVSQISQQVNSIIMALAGADRIFSLLDEPVEEDHGYVTLVRARENPDGTLTECKERTGTWAWKHPHQADGTITYTKLTGDVRLFDVDFAYEEGKTVLHDVSLYAKPGQKIAFVGATGAGKTTITNLINRFYDIADGKIRYDGININKIKKPDLRRSLGMVLQDVNLFTGTVMDNIRYGKLDATDEECIKAAKLANAHDFIMMLPQGYQTVLSGDGSGLSQGQRQLLSIARCAVADPPVMILDEATSSIDTRTEAIVQRGMDQLMKGRTVFVIAHRLSTVRNSNAIMVLEHGRIIERGDHDALLAQKGTYYQLYTGAFELE
ncbi:MAG TPA: ABC transporter ATP-binding protein [Candidatus Avoscillospira stercorigallinarum]|uniref:ABC transporter ATP-binding protein n=1 Tax=Candidatus Avoscillospira stercorigallinarum TaxID=2840708 RepID=A0A9D0Z6C2_9FIRM|nr:ABC transporter ATP-binding protein [Candidatus Avoscillospira stercorigallinarum]